MIQRCTNLNNTSYRNYGDRGISICDEWRDYDNFRAWAGVSGYQEGLTIERIDNNGNYEPGNCTWISKAQQNRNRRNVRPVTAWGETKLIIDWVEDERCGVEYLTLYRRLYERGWQPEKAIARPLGRWIGQPCE
jgi:hypothetical protein